MVPQDKTNENPKSRPLNTTQMICPLVDQPHEKCYCSELKSKNIEKILRYCRDNFQQCQIYKTLQGKI